MSQYRIPFNKPAVTGCEQSYVAQAMASGHISGDGAFTKRCHELLEREVGAKKALLTTSCTHALEMSALLLELSPGDEVILPSFTFVSTANAYVLRGAKPVFCDIRPDTLNLNERLLPSLITDRTKAIVVVHYAGVACEMDEILRIALERRIPVIEDNAHGLFGKYRGQNLGTFGAMATQSFHETKNFTCGEGGALLINDRRYVERAEILREKGTNRSRFFRGEVDKYTWVDLGSSYLPSDALAAFLFAQLEAKDAVQNRRREIWETYARELADWARKNGTVLPTVPAHCEQSWHMFYLLLPTLETRQQLISHLKERGILAVFHYLPLHISEMGQKLGGRAGDCPVTEDISDRLLRLPFYNNLAPGEQEQVIEAVREF
jgi:dTDP-4-amino-4,6-dideoxygalactose transaminase